MWTRVWPIAPGKATDPAAAAASAVLLPPLAERLPVNRKRQSTYLHLWQEEDLIGACAQSGSRSEILGTNCHAQNNENWEMILTGTVHPDCNRQDMPSPNGRMLMVCRRIEDRQAQP